MADQFDLEARVEKLESRMDQSEDWQRMAAVRFDRQEARMMEDQRANQKFRADVLDRLERIAQTLERFIAPPEPIGG